MPSVPAEPSELSGHKPSLMQGSAQVVRITKVKTNPHDTTVSMNDLIATSQNADYDGKDIAVFKSC